MRALNALSLKGVPSRPGKTSADPAKLTPPVRSRTPFTLSLLERIRQFWGERQIAKRAALDLEAGSDNHSTRLAHQPINRQKRPLMVSAAGKKQRGRQVITQVAKVAAAISTRFVQELPELRGGMVAQLGFLWGELGRRTLGKGIW